MQCMDGSVCLSQGKYINLSKLQTQTNNSNINSFWLESQQGFINVLKYIHP